jgi:imidazolonepropionase-like amidohydrolase
VTEGRDPQGVVAGFGRSGRTVITADRLFTGSELLTPGVVVLDGERIAFAGSQLPSESGAAFRFGDATILPGLIDAHSHVSIVPAEGNQIEQLRQPADVQLAASRRNVARDLASGVTTMRVLGQELDVDFELKREIDAGRTDGPALVCAGIQIARDGQHGHAITGMRTRDDIEQLARRNVAKGAGVLKIFATGGVSSSGTSQDSCPFTEDEIRCAADVAHAHGLKLAAHAHGGQGARNAIAGGVDTIEHAAALDDELMAMIADRRLTVVGTFSILFHPDGIERGDAGNAAVMDKVHAARETVARSWTRIVAAGLRVALGTDSMHGCLAFDLAKLVEYGATPVEALTAATAIGAEVCGLADRGRLAAGLRADLVIVRGDPVADIARVADPLCVVIGGRVLERG